MNNTRVAAFLTALLAVWVLSGCASIGNSPAPSYEVTFDEPERIRFSGKGAGAGMMLSSSMGPMGVAIGFAIDEGIAKTIHEQFEARGHTLDALAAVALEEVISGSDGESDRVSRWSGPMVLHVQRIGVKMSGSERVVADIQGSVTVGSEMRSLEMIGGVDQTVVTLDQVKSDGDATYGLLKGALVEVLRRGISK